MSKSIDKNNHISKTLMKVNNFSILPITIIQLSVKF